MFRSKAAILVIAPVLALALAAPANAQDETDWRTEQQELTRQELNRLLERHQRVARSTTESDEARRRAREEADRIRKRLEHGDFQVGDRIALTVANVPALTDTFAVRSGQRVLLPEVGEISVAGVLRSELEAHLRDELSAYVRDPDIRARSLIRIGVLGQVAEPGFYTVPSDALLSDLLMTAGGPAQGAAVEDSRIERGKEKVLQDDRMRTALDEGRTLDQLDLRAGDRLIVPAQSGTTLTNVVRWAAAILPSALFIASRVF